MLDDVDDYGTIKRLGFNAPSCVIVTARAEHPSHDGAPTMNPQALSSHAGLLALRARTDRWNAATHTASLTDIGTLVGWNSLALVYLSAVLARPSMQRPAALRDALASALAAGDTGPLIKPRDHERSDDHDQKVEGAFALFIEPYAGKPELALLDAAALCAPEVISVDLLRPASGLSAKAFGSALDELVGSGVLDLDGQSVNIHRLTQVSVRGHMATRGPKAKAAALTRLLDALIDLFRWPTSQAEQLLDHTRKHARLAAVAHAEAVLGHAGPSADTAFLRRELASFLDGVGMHIDAQRQLDAAIAWGEAQSPRDERNLAIDYSARAMTLVHRGILAGAEQDIARSIAWGEAQSPRDERSLAIRYATRASIRRLRGDPIGAEQDISRSIAWGEAQSPRDERSLAIDYASRSISRRLRGDLTGADQDIAKAIAWEEAQPHPDQRELSIRYAARASIRQDRGDLAGAGQDIARSIALGESQTPRDERSLAMRYAARASIRHALGDLSGAEQDIAGSIAWGEAQTPRDERSLAIRYAARASIRHDRGDLTGAERDIAKSIAWGEAQSTCDERSLAIWRASRASIRHVRGDLTGAEQDIAASIAWAEAQAPRDERNLAFQYETKARILATMGKFNEARAAIDESVRLHSDLFGANHEWTRVAIRRQQAIHAGQQPG